MNLLRKFGDAHLRADVLVEVGMFKEAQLAGEALPDGHRAILSAV